jgi:hypothetical protein
MIYFVSKQHIALAQFSMEVGWSHISEHNAVQVSLSS